MKQGDCEIIKDLLPLHCDQVCSRETREWVEEHLANCAECRSELEFLQEPQQQWQEIEVNLREGQVIKNISRKWRKDKWLSLFKGVLIAAVILGIAVLFFGVEVVRR